MDDSPALEELYRDLAAARLLPLWTQRASLLPFEPEPVAEADVWRWSEMLSMAERAYALVPVGRGGERRAIALANRGLGGEPFATPNLWAAIQYLGPGEAAPAHRHTQSAFRFIIEGRGVWTVVDGDPVEMRRGDMLLTPMMAWHEHFSTGEEPMVWLDGLDIPLVAQLDAAFFEFGPDEIADRSTPHVSRSEGLWAHPGLRPVSSSPTKNSPLGAYRWEHTDAALRAQLELEASGHPGVVEPGHAAVRYSNPTTGRDALPTMRTEMHRLRSGTTTRTRQAVGSQVWQVFTGEGTITVGDRPIDVGYGDVVTVPSWCPVRITARTELDLFVFSDAPVYEALNLARYIDQGDEA